MFDLTQEKDAARHISSLILDVCHTQTIYPPK